MLLGVPFYIFTHWHDKNKLPAYLREGVNNMIKSNPEFQHFLYDNKDCIEFFKKYFQPAVLETYNKIIPEAYKCDLWRYAVLYIFGGTYIDSKYSPANNIKYINVLTDGLNASKNKTPSIFVRDIVASGHGVYNAFIVSAPNNPVFLECINQIINNVKTKYYGTSALEPTGPLLLWKCMKLHGEIDTENGDIKFEYDNTISPNAYILYKNIPFIKNQHVNVKRQFYWKLYANKQLYKEYDSL